MEDYKLEPGELKRMGFDCTHPFYTSWRSMKSRCDNPNVKEYPYYGGKGITYCRSWKSFRGFYADMWEGWSKGLTLDRIRNDKNYEKENCRWATREEQVRTRDYNVIDEEKVRLIRKMYATGRFTQSGLAKLMKINHSTVSSVVQRKTWANVT